MYRHLIDTWTCHFPERIGEFFPRLLPCRHFLASWKCLKSFKLFTVVFVFVFTHTTPGPLLDSSIPQRLLAMVSISHHFTFQFKALLRKTDILLAKIPLLHLVRYIPDLPCTCWSADRVSGAENKNPLTKTNSIVNTAWFVYSINMV